MIRSTITEGVNNRLDAHVESRNGQSLLVVDARDDRGAFLNSLTLNASIVDPQLLSRNMQLKQVAPGRYEAAFDPQTQGAYFIRIGGSASTTGVATAGAQATGWVLRS